MRFAKGHGTENDFVLLPDPDGRLELSAAMVAALCDRRAGIGGDGVLRVVRTTVLLKTETLAESARSAERTEWFMDYRNADGSLAEMCGNGVRVFARYLVSTGLVDAATFEVGTRAGAKSVTLETNGEVTVDMGEATRLGPGWARLGSTELAGERISVGNPHLACPVETPVADVDLATQAVVDPAQFPTGVNVEVFRAVAPGTLEMRVHERGSGETRSCGTGIVAVAAAATTAGAEATWRVRVPGGECTVMLDAGGARLRGPAVIVAEGEVTTV